MSNCDGVSDEIVGSVEVRHDDSEIGTRLGGQRPTRQRRLVTAGTGIVCGDPARRPVAVEQLADIGCTRDDVVVWVIRSEPRLDLRVNNAGILVAGTMAAADIDATQRMIDLNVSALTGLTLAALPGFAARGEGAIIQIASVVPLLPERFANIYASTKAYVRHFSQALNVELAVSAFACRRFCRVRRRRRSGRSRGAPSRHCRRRWS